MPVLPTRFIIVCQARTGSTLLGSLVMAHHQIAWAGEYFKEIRRKAKRSLPRRLIYKFVYHYPVHYLNLQSVLHHRPAFGVKLMPHYAANFEQVLPTFQKAGWRIINLQRQNQFERALSYCVAQKKMHWISFVDRSNPLSSNIQIEPKAFLEIMRQQILLDELTQRSLVGIPHLKVVYEADLANSVCWQATIERVCSFLDLPLISAQAAVRKTWDRPYQEIVTNYADLVEVVGGSDLAYVLPAEKIED